MQLNVNAIPSALLLLGIAVASDFPWKVTAFITGSFQSPFSSPSLISVSNPCINKATCANTLIMLHSTNGDNQNVTSSGSKEDQNDNNNLLSYEDLIRDPILSQKEYTKSKQRRNNLFIFDDIGKAINVLLYAFVISSLCLQSAGYGFVIIPSGGSDYNAGTRIGGSNVRIVRLEDKAFILEMNGKDKEASRVRAKMKNQ